MCGCSTTFFLFSFFFLSFPHYFCHCWLFFSFCSVSLMLVLILYGGWRGLLGLTLFLSLPRLVWLPIIIPCQSGPLGLISFFLELLWPVCFCFAFILFLFVPLGLFPIISYWVGPLGLILFFLSCTSLYGPFAFVLLSYLFSLFFFSLLATRLAYY